MTNCHLIENSLSAVTAKAPSNTLLKLRVSARELFVADGYHNTRPQDIARHAGVASGTFYLHFKDKKQAFIDFADQAQIELVAMQKENLDGVTDHRDRWRIIFDTIIKFGIEHPGLLSAAFLDPVLIAPDDNDAWQMYDRLGEFVNLALKLDSESKTFQNVDYNLELISHAICGMLRHALTFAIRKGINLDKVVDDLSLFIDRGLGLDNPGTSSMLNSGCLVIQDSGKQ